MTRRVKIRVMILDDDSYALHWNARLIYRYPLTTVVGEIQDPQQLLDIAAVEKPDVVVIEPEYRPQSPAVAELITCLLSNLPGIIVICLTRRIEPLTTQVSFKAGARGYLWKDELGDSLAPALVRATQGYAIFTESAHAVLANDRGLQGLKMTRIPTWDIEPNLPKRFLKAFRLRIEHGLGTSMTARQTNLSKETIEKYISDIHGVYHDSYMESRDLNGINLDELNQEERTYTIHTALPKIEPENEFWAGSDRLNRAQKKR